MSAPQRGDFGHLCAIGGFTHDAAAGHRSRTYHGLVLELTTCLAIVRDDHARTYSAVRGAGWDWARPLALHASEGAALRLERDAAAGTWGGSGLADQVRDGVHELSGGGGRFRLAVTDESIAWREEGAIELGGRNVGCGLQWHDPSSPGGAYASSWFRVSGTALGAPVDGFAVMEQRYLPSGMLWAESPYAPGGELLVAWATFATEWDDGAVEVGHLCAGSQAWGFAMVTSGSEPVLLTCDVSAEPTASGTVGFRAGGEAWEWVPELEAEPVRPVESAGATQGLVRRVGERRTPRTWMARLERRPR